MAEYLDALEQSAVVAQGKEILKKVRKRLQKEAVIADINYSVVRQSPALFALMS